VSNKSRDPTASKQFCNVDGLQRRTFSAVYTKVCSLRSVGQKSKRWSDQEEDIIRKITKEQHEALTSLLNRRKDGGKTSTQLCNINGLQHRTVNADYIRLQNRFPCSENVTRRIIESVSEQCRSSTRAEISIKEITLVRCGYGSASVAKGLFNSGEPADWCESYYKTTVPFPESLNLLEYS
jgi:hypothetical protein